MNPADILAPLVLLCAFAGWVVVVPRLWHNEWNWAWDPDEVPGGWPFGAALWRGFARVAPLSGPTCGLLAVAFLGLRFGQGTVLEVVGGVFAGAAMVALALAAGVVFLNRPQRIVAPHLRHHPGAIREWLGSPVGRTQRPSHRPLR